MSETPSTRNAPCPCGSGQKFKRCCGATPDEPSAVPAGEVSAKPASRSVALSTWLVLAFAVAGAAFVVFVAVSPPRHPAPPPAPAPGMPAPAPANFPTAATPEPWFYDAANNRHWDPGHNHWHPGPPPPGVGAVNARPETAPMRMENTGEAGTLPSGTPPAWFYDAANDRHWDPGHNHWHPGPPPPAAARE